LKVGAEAPVNYDSYDSFHPSRISSASALVPP
jgi:hypothetical protein